MSKSKLLEYIEKGLNKTTINNNRLKLKGNKIVFLISFRGIKDNDDNKVLFGKAGVLTLLKKWLHTLITTTNLGNPIKLAYILKKKRKIINSEVLLFFNVCIYSKRIDCCGIGYNNTINLLFYFLLSLSSFYNTSGAYLFKVAKCNNKRFPFINLTIKIPGIRELLKVNISNLDKSILKDIMHDHYLGTYT